LTVAQVLDVIEATRSGSSAKKRHAAQDLCLPPVEAALLVSLSDV
jgi:hypothetical protein